MRERQTYAGSPAIPPGLRLAGVPQATPCMTRGDPLRVEAGVRTAAIGSRS
jgi:hypothetical protein